jgi:hypothetical protein
VSRLRLSTIFVVSPIDFPHLDSVSFIASTAPAALPNQNGNQNKTKKTRRGTGAKPKSKRAESVRLLPLEDEEAGPRDTYWLDSAAACACVGESDVSFSLQVTVF